MTTQQQEPREVMAEGALLALLFHFNSEPHTIRADRVTVSTSVDFQAADAFTDVTFWAGDIPVGGGGF